jgi:hypothetical protein
MRRARHHTTRPRHRIPVVACLAISSLLVVAAPAAELRRSPYLMAPRPQGMTVLWRTDDSVRHTAVLRYGRDPDKLDMVVQARENLRHFPGCRDWQADLRDLEPDTLYFYAVECDRAVLCGADDRHCFRTAPLPGTRRPLRFLTLGDSGSNRPRPDPIEAVLAEKGPIESIGVRNGFRIWNKGRPLDGIVLLGDNAYPAGTDEQYQASFFNVYADELACTPVWPCTGNHDIDDAFRHIFPVAGRGLSGGVKSNSPYYYAADIGQLHLVVLDPWRTWLNETPDPGHAPWRKQVAWLESDLAATEQPWIVVAQHFPLYCGGDYHSDDEPLTQVRRQLLPIFDRFGVDLSLAGHDHTFQRTYLLHGLAGPSDTYDPAVHRKSPSDGRTAPITKRRGRDGGTVHVVSGMGGGSRRAEKFAHPAMVPIDGALGTSRPGNLVIEIDGDRLTGTLVDMEGRETDRFTLVHEQHDAP